MVRRLQQMLRTYGYRCEVDGIFGTGTDQDVRALQARAGLTSDGIVGPLTWDRLGIA